MKNRIKCLLISAVLAGMAATALAQSNIYVATNGVDDGAAGRGQSWASPYATISNGIAKAPTAGDTVWVSNGAYVLSAALSLANAITVSAWSANAADTIVDRNGGGQGVSISAAATLAGFTISNGAVSGDGGGVSLANASCVVTNCIITRNRTTGGSGRGGGIYLAGGKVTDCIVSHNVSVPSAYPYGGGGLSCHSSYGSVMNCRFISNAAYSSSSFGGGISTYNVTPSLLVSNCVFDGNIASIGGGIGIFGSGCQFVDCAFSNNMATNGTGGGVYWGGGVISNCVIARNTSPLGTGPGIDMGGGTVFGCVIREHLNNTWSGGAVHMSGGSTLLNSSLINNTNSSSGPGGIFMRGTTSRSTVRNCLLANNRSSSGSGGVTHHSTDGTNSVVQNCTIVFNIGSPGGVSLSTNSFGHYGNIIYYNTGGNWYDYGNTWMMNTCTTPTNGLLGTGNITNAPLLIDTNSANYRLAKGSPCINTGLNQDWMTNSVDRDGRMRRRYGTVDMGAYEAVYNAFVFTAY